MRIQHRQRHRDGNAVVAAQRRAVGMQLVAVHHQCQALFFHVLCAAGHGLAHHVQMALQDHRLGLLVAGGAVFKNNDIAQLILHIGEISLLCKIYTPVADGFYIARPMGNFAHLLKKTEHSLGL
ncbi:hypothetical protein SDC9_125915 [bioreactor metagenome]|uniref:Uncharacterized protein n=1 Tax=bioreactor metagenome TaxID=1076179 RepID=A0A645CP89_9ZZZZ